MRQPEVVRALRQAGHRVYDFRNPVNASGECAPGFSWSEIDENWRKWNLYEYQQALAHPAAERGFSFDMEALRECDACVLVNTSGRSAHLEAGYAVGAGKPTAILLSYGDESELMYKMASRFVAIHEVVDWLASIEATPEPERS